MKKGFSDLLIVILAIVVSCLFSDISQAKVTGPCYNCHTIHNSQDGNPVDTGGQNRQLLVSNCVGCHSATDGATWKDSTTGAPIVNNSAAPSFGQDNQGLAGGNFYWVVAGDQSKGHNVLTLGVTEDSDSANGVYPPLGDFGYNGNTSCGCCHGKEWLADCTSCHVPKHHADDHPAGYSNVVDASGGYYRFLGSQSTNKHPPAGAGDVGWHDNIGVKGIEDPNWEANPTSAVHNEYPGGPMNTVGWGTGCNSGGYASISRWCSGCHGNAHNVGGSGGADGGTGTASPWLRHPTDFALPDDVTKEYQHYKTYNPQVPVARPDIDSCTGPSAVVTPGIDMVQCLSCHRPHGSPYADMLRWDYTGMIAGGGGAAGTGCFVCHTAKAD